MRTNNATRKVHSRSITLDDFHHCTLTLLYFHFLNMIPLSRKGGATIRSCPRAIPMHTVAEVHHDLEVPENLKRAHPRTPSPAPAPVRVRRPRDRSLRTMVASVVVARRPHLL